MRLNVREAPELAAGGQDGLSSSAPEQSKRPERPPQTVSPQRSRRSEASYRQYLLQLSSRFHRKIQSVLLFLHQPSSEDNSENLKIAWCPHHNQCDRPKTAALRQSDSPPQRE